jgi:predicted sulfurtransferase
VSCDIGTEKTHKTIAQCLFTDEPTNHCENCRYSACNARLICTPTAYRKQFGFCSSACVEKAQEDLLIKNIDRDTMDYKALRSEIKRFP